VIADDINILFV